jgi:lipopolysaccharide export system protein LptA
MRQLLNICFLIIATLSANALALPSDTEQKMHIVADSTLFNYKTRYNVYDGNVSIEQGKTRVTADRVTTQSNSQHKIEEAIAYGTKSPAHYWTLPKEGDTLFHASAKIIKFYPLKSTVVLEDNVVLTQGDNSFRGSLIIYNIKDQTVSAPATPKGHATFIFEPKQLTQ